MNARRTLYGLTLGAAVVAAAGLAAPGCDKSPDMPKANTNQPVPPPSSEDVAAQVEKARQEAMRQAGVAADAVKQAGANTADKISDAVNDAKSSDAARNAQAAAGDAAARAKEEGSNLLGKIESAIKENRLNEAQTYVDAFDRMKANVPDELKTRYEALKTNLKAAKDRATTPAAPATPAEPNK